LIVDNGLIKGIFVTGLFWWAWFRETGHETLEKGREFILSGMVMSVLSIVATRILAFSLPFRERPRFTPILHFRVPIGSIDQSLIHWSSFPSDHATLYFSLATCLLFISRKVGIVLYGYVLFVICLPRIYMGDHFPTDILAGAALGTSIASLSLIRGLREFLVRPLIRLQRSIPQFFYPCFYLGMVLIATNFDSVRELASAGWRVIKISAIGR
jgi:undecaprenyl-diphosphatase